jgi:hypothetical protein
MKQHIGGNSRAKIKRPGADVEASLSPSLNHSSPTSRDKKEIGRSQGLAATQVNLGSGAVKTYGEDFDNFIEAEDLQEWLERLEAELKQIKSKLKS